MKITAEFNSNEELIGFINTFGNKVIIPEKSVQVLKTTESKQSVQEPKVTKSKQSVQEPKVTKPKQDAKVPETTNKTEKEATVPETTEAETKTTKEALRALCSKAFKTGKQLEVKNIFKKFGADKLPNLKKENYSAVYKEVEVLI